MTISANVNPGFQVQNVLLGGWGPAESPTAEDLDVFKKAIAGRLGVDLAPLAVQKQIVAGTNYCFYCISTPVVPSPEATFVRVEIQVPPNGTPLLAGVSRVSACHLPNAQPGGWSGVRPLSADDKKVFAELMRNWTGVGYAPLAVQSQVVTGNNYCYFCIATLVYREPSSSIAAVNAYAAPGKAPVITEISTIYPL